MHNRAASDEFRTALILLAYAFPDAHPQDLSACRARDKILDEASERLWCMAYRAGVEAGKEGL